MWKSVLVALGLYFATSVPAEAQEADFNSYILKAIDSLNRSYSRGGYDISQAFTHDIVYGSSIIRKTSGNSAPAPSMCVAGVAEIIITAINIYANETRDVSVYTTVPSSLWTRGNQLSLRANIFMFAGTGSRGTAHTLSRFGMGRELGFDALKPGDFINLNRPARNGRRASGHSVVFLGFLDGSGNDLPSSVGAEGFKYFSVQGSGRPDAGFGYRWAFFGNVCPSLSGGRVRDCGVLRSRNPIFLNAGRMNRPSAWRVEPSIRALRNQGIRSIMAVDTTVSRAAAIQELETELPDTINPALDGVEGD